MAKKLNKNVVVGLTVAGMALTTAAGIMMVLSLPKTDPGPIAEQAKAAAEKGEHAQAWKLYQRAAGRAKAAGDRSRANEYLIAAGDAALTSGDAQRARKLWNEVLLNDPLNLAAQEKVVGFLIEFAEHATAIWPEVQNNAEKLLSIAAKNNTKSPLGLNALGRALIAQRGVKESNVEEGKKNLIAAVAEDKSNPRYARDLANYYVSEGDVKSALAVYDVLMASLPKEAKEQSKAYLYRGQFYGRDAVQAKVPEGDKLAVASFERAVELAPKDVDTLVGFADYWHYKKNRAQLDKAAADAVDSLRTKARQQYEQAVQADPDHYTSYLQLAQLYAEDAKYDESLSVLTKRIERGVKRDHYLGWRNQRYMLMIRQKAFAILVAKLYNVVLASSTTQPDDPKPRQAIIDQLNQLYKETVAEATGGADEPLALYMHGRLLMINDDFYGALRDFKRLLDQTHSQDAEIHRLLGELYAHTGAPGLAEDSLRIVVANDPTDPTTHSMLATVLNQLNRPEEALNEAERALQLDPENKNAQSAKMQAYQLQRNWDGVKQMQKVFTPGEGSPEDMYNRALLLQLQATEAATPDAAKLAEAENLLRTVVKADPLNFSALQRLVTSLAQRPDSVAQAMEIIAGTRAQIETLRTQSAATQPEGDRTRRLTDAITNIDLLQVTLDASVSSEEKAKRREELIRKGTDPYAVAVSLTQLYSEQGRLADAFAAIKEAYKLRPNEPQVVEAAFRFALNSKDWKMAEELADKAVALGMDPSGGRFYRGRMLLARTDLEQAVKELRQAIAAAPTYPEGYATLGEALAQLKQYEEAQQFFEQARKLNPRNATAAIGLAQLAGIRGDEEAKQKYLTIAAQVAPSHSWVLAEMQEEQDRSDPKRGIARREEIRKQNPKNVENLLRLAALYRRDGRNDSAKAAYQEARQLQPEDLRIARDYASFLLAQNPPEVDAAHQLLVGIVQKVDPKDSKRKAAAQLLLASSLRARLQNKIGTPPKLEEVEAAYVAAAGIASTPAVLLDIGNFYLSENKADKAEEWLRKSVAAAKDPADRELKMEAFRTLIQSELTHNDPQTAPTVQKDIDAYRDAFPDDNLYLILQARFHNSLGKDAETIRSLTDFINKESQQPLGYYQRGLAYFRQSEWKLAVNDLREAKRLAPGTIQPRLLLAIALENLQQADAAISELQNLLEEKPDAPGALPQLMGLYLKLKRYEAADSLVTSFSKKNPELVAWDGYRVQIALARGATDQAIQHAKAGIEKSKYDLAAIDTLLNIYSDAGRHDELIAYIAQLPAERREDKAIVMRLAAAHLNKKDYDRGLELASQSLSAAGQSLGGFMDILNRAVLAGDKNALIQAVRQRAQKDPQNRANKLIQAITESASGQATEAVRLYRELLTGLPAGDQGVVEKAAILQQLALQLYNQKQFEESRKVYEEILKDNPTDASSLNNLAYLLLEQFHDPNAALPHARRAALLVPDFLKTQKVSVLDTLGWNFVLLNMFEQAIPTLQKAIELNSQVTSVHYHLAECFYRRSQSPNNPTREEDLKRAKAEVQQSHELLQAAGRDDENVLPQIVELGAKLGLNLDKNILQKK